MMYDHSFSSYFLHLLYTKKIFKLGKIRQTNDTRKFFYMCIILFLWLKGKVVFNQNYTKTTSILCTSVKQDGLLNQD